jgi:hypothetical protein
MTDTTSTHAGFRADPVVTGLPDDDRDERSPTPPSSSNGGRLFLVLLAVATALGALGYFAFTQLFPVRAPATALEQPTVAPSSPTASPALEPVIRHPLDTNAAAPGTAALPALNESDVPLIDELMNLLGREAVGRWLLTSDVVRRMVVTVDNLPRKTLPQRLAPLKAVPGAFGVTGQDGQRTIAAENAARYAPLVRMLESVDADKAVALYVRWYPLFQEAYREQGYPKGYFNDRLVEALDVMIAAPAPTGPIALVQPRVLYEFADPAQEALPAGQKIMLRIGAENAARVKAKLAQIRKLVATQPPT